MILNQKLDISSCLERYMTIICPPPIISNKINAKITGRITNVLCRLIESIANINRNNTPSNNESFGFNFLGLISRFEINQVPTIPTQRKENNIIGKCRVSPGLFLCLLNLEAPRLKATIRLKNPIVQGDVGPNILLSADVNMYL